MRKKNIFVLMSEAAVSVPVRAVGAVGAVGAVVARGLTSDSFPRSRLLGDFLANKTTN